MKYNTPENIAEFISRSNLTWNETPKNLSSAVAIFNKVAEEIGEEDGLSLFFMYRNPAVAVRVKNAIKAIA